MDDNRTLRMWFQGFLSLCLFMISLWTGKLEVMIVGFVLIPPLSFVLPRLLDSVSALSAFLIYGTGYSNPSYENRFYQNDMDRAKKLVREGKLSDAIWVYRQIIQKAPKMYEARFNLARIYQMAGQVGLALQEYDSLRNLRYKLGPNHVFVRESERIIEEMRGTLPRKQV
jgi:hypothetical protein